MHPENRRSFVKKSVATSISLSSATFFSSLIRARGEEGGGETTETTTLATTEYFETTFATTIDTTIDTTDNFQTTFETTITITDFFDTTIGTTIGTDESTIDLFETTFPIDTTAESTEATTAATVSEIFYLVCIAAPTDEQIETAGQWSYDPDDANWKEVSAPVSFLPSYKAFRTKKDKLEVSGPKVGDFAMINPPAGSNHSPNDMPPITAKVSTILCWSKQEYKTLIEDLTPGILASMGISEEEIIVESNGTKHYWVVLEQEQQGRYAQETQMPTGNINGQISFLAASTVKEILKTSSNGSGSFDRSSVTGGVAIIDGVVKASTLWKDPGASAGGGINLGPLGWSNEGTPATDDMTWGEESLEWGFRVMTYNELIDYQLSLMQQPRASGCN